MAEELKKISGLVELADIPSSGDLLVIVDISEPLDINKTKKILYSTLLQFASAAEINAGSISNKPISTDQLAASNRNIRYAVIRFVDSETEWDDDNSLSIRGSVPIPFSGTIVSIKGDVDVAGVGGTSVVDVNINSSTIMGNYKLRWDQNEISTDTYSGTPPTITQSEVSAGDLLTVDIDTNHTTTRAKGLTVTIGIRMD
jgi:hypothetical protein